MASKHCNDVCVVIRSSGERTEGLCHSLVAEQVGEDRVFVITEHPFAQAIATGFDVAQEINAPWTLILDADVLLKTDAICEFMRIYGRYDMFAGYALVLDKFWGEPVGRGVHFYRTEYVREARELVDFDPQLRKPGTFVIRKMQARGHLFLPLGLISGLHGFEQSYQHIYVSMFNRAIREGKTTEYLLRRCRVVADTDDDFRVACAGLEDGMERKDSVLYLDFSSYPDIKPCLDVLGIKDKETLNTSESRYLPDQLLTKPRSLRFCPPTVSELFWEARIDNHEAERQKAAGSRSGTEHKAKKVAPIRPMARMMGKVMSCVGGMLQRWANNSEEQ